MENETILADLANNAFDFLKKAIEQFDEEPQTSSWRRFQVWFISLFPIEDEL